jgi:hypothetical protein
MWGEANMLFELSAAAEARFRLASEMLLIALLSPSVKRLCRLTAAASPRHPVTDSASQSN